MGVVCYLAAVHCSLWNRSNVKALPSGFGRLCCWFYGCCGFSLGFTVVWFGFAIGQVCYGVGEARSYGLVHICNVTFKQMDN